MVLLGRSLGSSVECGLDASESDSASHRRFDEVAQGLALLEDRLEFGTQLWLDADLGNDGVPTRPENGLGGFWATQILPFGEPASFVGYMYLESATHSAFKG